MPVPDPLFGSVKPLSFQHWQGEVPIMGGSAKSSELDRDLLDKYIESGGRQPRRLNALEPDWLRAKLRCTTTLRRDCGPTSDGHGEI